MTTSPKTTKKKAATRLKCRTCGGHCGKKKGQPCQHAKNAERRWADELFAACIGESKA